MNQIVETFAPRRYESLLASLLLLMFGNLIVPDGFQEIAQSIFLVINITIGLLVFKFRPLWRVTVLLILLDTFILLGIQTSSSLNVRAILSLLYILYFIILSIKVYHVIYTSKTTGKELIVVSFCGFVMLGILASFVFMMLEHMQPGAFLNIGTTAVEKYQNIRYFSFITTLTVGYGDIVPSTHEAKQLTALFGIIGNFYSVFVLGIVIGKYLNNK